MGFLKQMQIEEWERGWSHTDDKFVCPDHLEDDALAALIEEKATSTACSYCGHEDAEPFAAPLDVLVERIACGISHEWCNADDEGVGWEGGYVGDTCDTWDLITDRIDSAPLNHGELITDVVRALPEHAWAQRDYYRLVPHLL